MKLCAFNKLAFMDLKR